jgi:dTDP-glucose 4,6-dehydratase
LAMRVLLTGAAGFAGSHIADEIVKSTDWEIVALDCLTYAGKMSNLNLVPKNRMKFICHDFSEPLPLDRIGHIDYIIHNGAETHVTNSLRDPQPFIQSNVIGTYNLLETARELRPQIFLYTSTDEVFGASLIPHKEDDPLCPSNPYSASKAAGEMLCKAYQKCFSVPCIITRTTNMFGKRQHPEKFIPMTIEKLRDGQEVIIHTNSIYQIGSRQWIHVSDQARAILFILENGEPEETYHIAGVRRDNFEVARTIANGRDGTIHLANAYKQFPGHDLHYALDDAKLRSLGWKPILSFEEGIALTV